ncbi:S-locus glycoprotein domain-containing protein [Artemisia annua]|uniref:S-locus glycoprotein domain-containing protein n=1 Tax=Artemisia annua TaxID=35608 RepID=A0A2U1KXK7_ARTAN|nr:S-locus glycoprotein domain-containing protein [Artemisia annua]
MVKGKYIQVYLRKSSVIITRIGPYNGITFAGQLYYKPDPHVLYKTDMIVNQNEMYNIYTYNSTRFLLRTVATPAGKFEASQLNLQSHEWMQSITFPMDYCDNYGLCGPYGVCSSSTNPNCVCLKGFESENLQELNPYNGTSGCQRSKALDCGLEEGFLKFSSMKLPDTQNAVYNGNMNLHECEVACKRNCSCIAYANPNITSGEVGCLQWFGDLVDLQVYPQNGQHLYLRLAASELSVISTTKRSHRLRHHHQRACGKVYMIQKSGSEESQLAIETSGRGATKESLIHLYMQVNLLKTIASTRVSEQCERMRTDLLKTSYDERNIGEDIASLRRGACLLKYGHKGKPNFCPFCLSNEKYEEVAGDALQAIEVDPSQQIFSVGTEEGIVIVTGTDIHIGIVLVKKGDIKTMIIAKG